MTSGRPRLQRLTSVDSPKLSRRQISAALLPLASAAQGIAHAQDVAPPPPTIVVANRIGSTVAFVDPAEGRLVSSIPAPTGPHEVAVSGDGLWAVVTGYGYAPGPQPGTNTGPNNVLSIIDVANRREVDRVNLHFLRAPHGIGVFDRYFYFTSEFTRCVGRYDIFTKEIDWVRGVGSLGLHMLVVSPDGRKVYTANIVDATVARIPVPPPGPIPPEQDRIKYIQTAPATEGIGITPDGAEVWVGSNANGSITIIDTSRDEVVGVIPQVGQISFRIAFTPDGSKAFVTSPPSGQIVVLDRYSRQVIHRMQTGPSPQGIAISPDGRRLASGMGTSTLIADTETYEVLARVDSGIGSDGLAWAGAR
jgi:YVTN family beta-propeller protein